MIGHLDKVLRPINLILPKTSGHIKTFTVTDGNKDKNIDVFPYGWWEAIRKYKTVWTKTEELQNKESI